MGPQGRSAELLEFPDHVDLIENGRPPSTRPGSPRRRLLSFLNSTFTETPGSLSREGRPELMIHPTMRNAWALRRRPRRDRHTRGEVVLHARLFDGVRHGVVIAEGICDGALERARASNVLTGDHAGAPYGGAAFHDNKGVGAALRTARHLLSVAPPLICLPASSPPEHGRSSTSSAFRPIANVVDWCPALLTANFLPSFTGRRSRQGDEGSTTKSRNWLADSFALVCRWRSWTGPLYSRDPTLRVRGPAPLPRIHQRLPALAASTSPLRASPFPPPTGRSMRCGGSEQAKLQSPGDPHRARVGLA